MRFLLVDDIEENLVALEALLRRDGLVLLKARSGMEALELLLAHEVALAFLDVQMPGMDGFELAELMRGAERTKHVPIIFITAGNRDPLRIFKGYESGAVDFLYKPIEPHVLRGKADVFFELYRQRKEYAHALRLNELFVGILGHDLRNPLGALVTGTQLLEAQVKDEKQLRTLQRMRSAGQRMTDMIEQLLDLTRARLAGGLGFARTRRRVDVKNLVERTIEELHGLDAEHRILVEAVSGCTTTGDPDRLLQLFSNIIANALHHGQAGSPVEVKLTCSEQEVCLSVHNDGVIAPELLPTLFDPFRKRGTTRSKSRGLGLGLFISQQIALAHGGSVEVESTAETGTLFTVRIPRRQHDERPHEGDERLRTVLVVDDDQDTRESLQEAFEEEGYTAVTACDGREALERLADRERRPDVVVLDLVLPILDGNRVYAAMQADPQLSSIPVVASTASPAGAPSGVVVVPKPLKLERLLETVAGLCPAEPPG
ncbi:MAG TPA: response regulator [Polyangiaceae bacterium]|nr:response regulator [Polyangiaceae bacterium]